MTVLDLTDQERRVLAACVAVVAAGVLDDDEVRDLLALWLRVHPDSLEPVTS